jgi:glycerophosphoryl diester phosphodiesterase
MAAAIPLIIAHRGASEDAPENTLAAFKLAWEQGADGIEGDFRLSSDGVIVSMHDATTSRVSERRLNVARTTFEVLREVDVGSWKDPKWASERIPSLEEVLCTVPKGKKIFIEIKCGTEIMEPFQNVIEQSGLQPEQIAVIAFDEAVIDSVKRLLPALRAYWITDFSGGFSLEKTVATLKKINADGLSCEADSRRIDENFVDRLRQEGMEIHVWTVDAPKPATYFSALGVDSISTNGPDRLKTLLES